MFKLIKYLRHYKAESVIGPLFKLLEACFELAVPLVVSSIIDRGIKNSDTEHIIRMCLLMVLLALLGFVCSLTAQFFAAKAATGFGCELRDSLFAHVNSLSHAELDKLGTPQLITRLTNDVNTAQTGVNLVLRLFLRSPFIVAGSIVMAFTIDVKLALIFLAATPLIALVIWAVMAKTFTIYRGTQKQLDRVSLITRENLSGVRVIRAFRGQNAERERFDETLGELKAGQELAGRISALQNPLTYVIINAAIMLLIYGGAFTVNAGSITQGELLALVNYMSQILLALLALALLVVSVTKASASAARINEVFAVTPSVTEPENAAVAPVRGAPRIAFENVSFSYTGEGEDELEGISFAAAPGETVGIIGGTGAGKSTLCTLIPRFYDVKDGRVLVDGQDVRSLPLTYLRSAIGMVPQRAVLFKGSVRDNMRWGKKDADDSEIIAALRTAQAYEFVFSRPEGLDYMLEQGGRNLSGGQRQRLTIARALVMRPSVLILDDSSSALDYATDAALREALRRDTEGMTVIMVSQRSASIRYADHILVLDDGKIAGEGTHAELLADCPVYREICLSQESEEEASK